MPIAAWLMTMVLPIVKKVMIALGISVVTYVGLSAVMTQIQNSIIASLGGMTGAAAQLAAMFGFHESVGIILAAVTTKFSMAQLTKWVRS